MALPWFGLIFFLGISVIALGFVRAWPKGHGGEEETRSTRPWVDWHAFRSRFFLGSGVAYTLIMGAQVGAISHLINHFGKSGWLRNGDSVGLGTRRDEHRG
ncbi:MAG: hypothetical protein CM1200mP9_02340 [Gammaproteobacteria bacterium]|nr:MAG: hypothetical protein CM1200mP9_02340 [Gammaproteobacteria bacterium]